MGAAGSTLRDPDARVTMKRKRVHFGDKAHLAVDDESGLVPQAEITSANSRLGEALSQGDEQGYFVNKFRIVCYSAANGQNSFAVVCRLEEPREPRRRNPEHRRSPGGVPCRPKAERRRQAAHGSLRCTLAMTISGGLWPRKFFLPLNVLITH